MVRGSSLSWLAVIIGLSLQARPADACGLKLTGKSTKSPKVVSQSDNPSRILIIGDPGSNLERTLERAGHYVEVVSEPYEIKTRDFRVVLVDEASAADAARVNFPAADVISLNKDVRKCLATVEKTLSREPTSAMAQRPALAAREERTPVARSANAQEGRELTASGGGPVEPNDAPKREPEAVKTASTDRVPAERASDTVRKEPAPVEPAPVARENAVLVSKIETPARSAEAPKSVKREVKAEEPSPIARTEKTESKASRRNTNTEDDRASAGGDDGKDDHLFFALSSVRLSARTTAHLNKQLAWLKANPSGSLRLEGHADSLGPQDHNMELSERRLQSVWSFFEKNGIAEGRVQMIARGESQPVFDPPENPNNRCVVIQRQ